LSESNAISGLILPLATASKSDRKFSGCVMRF